MVVEVAIGIGVGVVGVGADDDINQLFEGEVGGESLGGVGGVGDWGAGFIDDGGLQSGDGGEGVLDFLQGFVIDEIGECAGRKTTRSGRGSAGFGV